MLASAMIAPSQLRLVAGIAILAISGASVSAQQFPRHSTQYDIMGLSGRCVEALNVTVQCHDALAANAPDL
ncbi:hypothetical protein PT974_07399 [Cladobotryum mycophilum]|uniref:Uncharacterized protein n=1 Tax=Cladobotryum mycophilum TaxID=491253 RepID=A0ABR0SQB3_9HYPO